MPLSADEQKLLDFALAALPHWYQEAERDYEFENASAKMAQDAMDKVTDWLVTQARISTATGATSTEPDWLGQHALDRGTSRFDNESDATLAARIKDVPESLTLESMSDAISVVLTADGVSAAPALIELRSQRAFINTERSYPNGTTYASGGTFATTAIANQISFTPTDSWDGSYTPIKSVQEERGGILVIVQSATAGNVGSFPITSMDGNAVLFSNASGVAEVISTVQWCIDPTDLNGERRSSYDLASGRATAYLRRGYRIGSQIPKVIAILPEGSSTAATASVDEIMQRKRAAGVDTAVETKKSYGSITYVGAAYTGDSGAAFGSIIETRAVSVPAGVADGDLLLLAVIGEYDIADMYPTTGTWYGLKPLTFEPGNVQTSAFEYDRSNTWTPAQLYYRFASSESSTINVTINTGGGGGDFGVVLAAYRGVDQSNPFLDSQIWFSGPSSTYSNSADAQTPPYTLGGVNTDNSSVVVGLFLQDQSPVRALSASPAYTERLNANTGDIVMLVADLTSTSMWEDGPVITGATDVTAWGVTLALRPEEA
jgi:hypothetical protein